MEKCNATAGYGRVKGRDKRSMEESMSDWIFIPKNVHILLNSLHAAGYEAYIVGGCVRDCADGATGRRIGDITTSAEPDQVKAIFRKTYDAGNCPQEPSFGEAWRGCL
ncbi:MAG: hypothetical protein ACLR23_03570 [Clostridia bacterium]